MGEKTNTARILLGPANADLSGQSKVNAEIFSAMEILGRKLERVEAERDRLARRLALIESAATVDEKTGKLFLPVVTEQPVLPPQAYSTPKWMVSASLMSSAVALFALGLVLFRDPAPALTKDQIALLESLRGVNLAQISPDSKGWKTVNTDIGAPETASSSPAPDANNSLAAADTATPPAASMLTPVDPAKTASAAPATSPAPEAAKPVQTETAAATTPALDPQTTPIPGEDKAADIKPAPAKIAKAAPRSEPPALSRSKTPAVAADVVARTEAEGGISPDAELPEKVAALEKRAYQGVSEAQHDLATLYASGKLIPQDYQRARFWFEKAADGGVANAHYNLGVIYHQGLGVPVDMAQAINWYQKAAELGHPEAMYNLGIAYIEGVGTKTDTAKGVDYFKRAANAGVAQAAYNLGVLYESNFIGPIDTKKAMQWYQVAAKQGHADARTALARLNGGTAVAEDDSGNQALTLADMAEPAAGGDNPEETGEGDSSPVSENRHAATGDAVNGSLADVQRILIKQGLLQGKATGTMDARTEEAIRAVQHKLNLTEDGQPTQELLDKLLQMPPVARP